MIDESKPRTRREEGVPQNVVERLTGQQALDVLSNLHRKCIVEVGIAHVPTKVWNLENLDLTESTALFYEWEDAVSGWDDFAAETLSEAPKDMKCYIVNDQVTPEVIQHAEVIVFKNYHSGTMSHLIPQYSELGQDQELIIIIHGYYVTTAQLEHVKSDLLAKGYPNIWFEERDNRQQKLVGTTGFETGEKTDNQLYLYRIGGLGSQS